MESIDSLLRTGGAELELADIPDARREASSLLASALDCDRAFLIAHPEHVPEARMRERYLEHISRRARREPFHYITGKKEFYGLEFAVTPAVLIPRPETEMLVERGIELLRDLENPRFCEVGVGSACISVAMLVNVPQARGIGLDISEPAIEIARQNVRRHDVALRFELRLSDVLAGLSTIDKFDLIVSNPPYVPAGDIDGLQPEVRDHEPLVALTGGSDGLSVVSRLIVDSPLFLKPGGALMMEIGFSQSEEVLQMFTADKWSTAAAQGDFQGIPRMITARLKDS